MFIPISVDAYVLPRASLTLAGGGLLLAAGLIAGRRALGPLRLAVLAAAVAAVAAGLLSVAPSLSLAGAYSRYESLPVRLAYLALFCGAAWVGERRHTVTAFLAGCGVASVEALLQAATHALPRADGNLGNANLLGALLAMAVPLAADRARTAPPGIRRSWLALCALLGAGLVASTSRSGWLGALAGLLVVTACVVSGRRLWGVVAGGAVALAVAFALIASTPLRALNDDKGEARLGIWHDAVAVIAERPVLGWGEDTLGLVFGRHQSGDWAPGHNLDRAHSMPLDLAAAQGLAGLAACTWLLAVWWLGVWRRRAQAGMAGLAGAAAAYLAWSLVNFDWAPATAAFWLLAGAAWPGDGAVVWRPRPESRTLLVAVGAALLGLALAVPAQVADVLYYAGRTDVAVAIDPLQPAYHAALGTRAGLRRAAELGDPGPGTYVALGDAEERAGNPVAARAAYRRALELYPFDRDARQRLGVAARS